MKIKRLLLYVLIVLALTVSFIPSAKVNASGTCSDGYSTTASQCGSNEGVWTDSSAGSTVTCNSSNAFGNGICKVQQLLNQIIPLLVALGVVYFIWGVVQYVIGGGEEAKKKGRDHIIYGLIGLAIIISLAGIINITVTTFGLGSSSVALNTSSLVTVPNNTRSTCTPITTGSTFANMMDYVTCVIGSSVIPLIFAIAMVSFVWGAVKFFIIDSDEEAKREQGKQFMIWGIIALAVMISVWGLVNLLGSTFGVGGSTYLPKTCPPGSNIC
jgi:hypothetical protein